MSLVSDSFSSRNTAKDGLIKKTFQECPKCGARGGCEKHGLSASGISYREGGKS